MPYQISLEFCDAAMFGDETIRLPHSKGDHQPDWMYSQGRKPHPALCSECGTKRDLSVCDNFSGPRKKFDLSVTYDGFVILGKAAAELLERLIDVEQGVIKLTSSSWFCLDVSRLPIAKINVEKSGVRRDLVCPVCHRFTEVLLGLVPGAPPTPKPLVLRPPIPDAPIFCSDLSFGSNHGQTPVLFMSDGFAKTIESELESGFYLHPLSNVR